MKSNLIVIKFGGTSVGSTNGIINIKKIIKHHLNSYDRVVVVLSAFSKVTDLLKNLSENSGNRSVVEEIKKVHLNVISELNLSKKQSSKIHEIIDSSLDFLFFLSEKEEVNKEKILSFGETLSTKIIQFLITKDHDKVQLVDAYDLIVKNNNTDQTVNDELTSINIQKSFDNNAQILIVPGFIAKDHEGVITTLGRGGSDYTATILAKHLNASIVEIWSDVDGFMTANPKHVPSAKVIRNLNFREAFELSHFGAKIIYPPSLIPALTSNISVKNKKYIYTGKKGTLISNALNSSSSKEITGITADYQRCVNKYSRNSISRTNWIFAKSI